MAAAVTIANEVIFRAAAERPERHGMGTTLVAALMDGSRLSVVHVGDSRFYLFRGGRIVSVTRDHSFVAEQVARGLLTPAEAETSEAGNILTRALGVAASVEVDAMEPSLRNGDVALLCSDGLSKMVEDAAIVASLRDSKEPFQMCHNLVQLALERGGRDNVTVAAGRVRRERLWERATRLWRRSVSGR
ncbi:MAG: serine/threonine-protein phosphatase [Elusimicrobia bacterium]|nr:serine/threonine-protein phosphatase [Elusimicrobiota bacterium]